MVMDVLTCEAAAMATATTKTTTTDAPTPILHPATRRTKPLWNETETDRLKHDLLLNYDKFARPHAHDQHTEVDLLLVIKHLDVDEFQSTMTIDAWTKMSWTDPKLTWKPDQYGNLTTLYVADHEIWQPDIMLYNSASHPAMSSAPHETPYLIATNDGKVIWVPPTRLEVYCNLNLRHWPYDIHTCEFKMGSWVYDKASIDILTNNGSFSHDPHVEGEPWAVLDTTFERKETMYTCCPESYVDVSFSVTVQRRGSAYHTVLTAPLFASIALLMFSFFVPYHRVEKTLLHGVNIIMLTITLMCLTHIVPVLTNNPPIIVEMYGVVLFMAVGCAGIAIGLQNMTGVARPWPLPAIFKRVVTHPNVRLFIAGAFVDEILETSRSTSNCPDTVPILNQGSNVESMNMVNNMEMVYIRNRRDWCYFALFCERAIFCLWSCIFIVITCIVG
ncbi:hypothetical protein ONE63_006935 [Megalurothrips usitatus]|uniref:Neurotransmitter-gated ion-channel ligand-binding domain-containing protein n=1 Tax=Megalurothrips usitatus TaxID=439358 RepID=A0AAV7XUJ5_9NEOP|nr:hypothetical protein ONE63_006935 [Megalurothrips usitatus]